MEENLFLYNLLGKRKRRLLILTRWLSQSNGSIGGAVSLEESMKRFIELILYAPIRIHLLKDGFRIFDEPDLMIYYSWLFQSELEVIKKFYLNRIDYFTVRNFYVNDTFHFYGTNPSIQLPVENRRELVRDYVGLFYAWRGGGKGSVDFINFTLLHVCQQLLLRRGGADVFIVELHHVLQGRVELGTLLCR